MLLTGPRVERRRSTRRRDRLLERIITRARGEQTIARLLSQGLVSSGNFYMASRTHIDPGFAWAVTIGDKAVLAHDVIVIAHDAAARRVAGYTVVRRVEIGPRAYIGAGSLLLPGARVGAGAIIGAGSVVRGDIPEGAVAVGIPARVVSDRAQLAAKHREAMETLPVFDIKPRAAAAAARLDELREALDAHGSIYVR